VKYTPVFSKIDEKSTRRLQSAQLGVNARGVFKGRPQQRVNQARHFGKAATKKGNAAQYFSLTSSWVSPFMRLKQEAVKPAALKKSAMAPAASSVAAQASPNTPRGRLDM